MWVGKEKLSSFHLVNVYLTIVSPRKLTKWKLDVLALSTNMLNIKSVTNVYFLLEVTFYPQGYKKKRRTPQTTISVKCFGRVSI